MTEKELKSHLASAEKDPQQVAAAVSGLPDKVLRYKPAPDKWSILEILAHLADVEIVYGYRLRQMLADKQPTIAPIDQDDWARNLAYTEASPPELVAQYALLRRSNLRLLKRIQPQDLERGAFHPELNRKMTLADLVERIGTHGPNHLQQIERLKREAR